MRKIPPLNALKAFEATARHLSFTRAADELCVTQGAVSRHVRKLEEYIGVALMQRNTRQVTLSEAGDTLLAGLTHAFNSIEQTVDSVHRQHGSAHHDLNLVVSSGFAMLWLIPRLSVFQADDANPHLRLTTRAGNVDFDRDLFDAGIIYGAGKWPDVCADLLFQEHLLPVCAPQLMQGANPPNRIEHLNRYTLLHSSPDHRDWRTWLQLNQGAVVDPAKGLAFESMDATLRAASLGHGIAICDTTLMREELASKWLVAPFKEGFYSGQGYYLVYPKSRENLPQIELLRTWLKREIEGAIAVL